MGRYTHLTLAEREEIMLLRHEGRSYGEIALATGRDKSTISREIDRNSFKVGTGRCYRASTAQRRYEERRLACARPRRLDDGELAGLVVRLIARERWSPEQIAGRIGLERPDLAVSASTIYRAINGRELDPPDLARTRRGIKGRLRRKGKRRHRKDGPEERRGKIPDARPISERPAEVEERSRLGDWEGDTVVGKGAGACLVTLVDRKSGLLAGGRAATHTKRDVARVESRMLREHPETRTITLDRGMEFADFKKVEQSTGAVCYFALPHHPWQRGSNENTNGLVREYFPKGTDFATIDDDQVQAVYDAINHRPRKRHGYRTPWEIHHSTTLHLL
ncbi:transposase for insertion sequence elementIS4351 [Bifidobacterium lemurum]|uniref:Transposase for insertion sequence elementIS4351 n=7 Tax=Bifidobacterium lemurum TaxID=1603886 RepID=A0A261FIL8_9BIFI|nr:IS30 family transposase [Bifidobacterium lemurum]OZG58908.1 transposase for insertion sequence elementIS4351 [Bifidobacterium lemurum]QOL34035.1 IS30 family transposase [Bifidobacterium lemurum]QOL34434.1 IS30 family transposase [Bifidobacterium lemurum]QOL35021.1 IS30 family transposase [Bifidobacterium lemurum]